MGAECLLHHLCCFRMDNRLMENISCPYIRGSAVCSVSICFISIPSFFITNACFHNRRWGATAMSTGFVQNTAQLIACRALLGVFEAAFGAGAPYFLSLFYHRRELGFRLSLLLGMSPIANCFASALAYGITRIGQNAWRYLLIIGKH